MLLHFYGYFKILKLFLFFLSIKCYTAFSYVFQLFPHSIVSIIVNVHVFHAVIFRNLQSPSEICSKQVLTYVMYASRSTDWNCLYIVLEEFYGIQLWNGFHSCIVAGMKQTFFNEYKIRNKASGLTLLPACSDVNTGRCKSWKEAEWIHLDEIIIPFL